MGVTYKIKQEIIDFIIQKKRSDPSLSCRKLTAILDDTFHIEVSKSSINAVLKGSSLSSPVGRTRGPDANIRKRAPKIFLIPSEKKEQLLAQVVPFLGNLPETAADKVPEVVTPASAEKPAVQAMVDASKQEVPAEVQEPVEALSLPADIMAPEGGPAPLSPSVPPLGEFVWDGERGALLEKAGYILVRAVMQDMLRRPSLGYVMARGAGIEPSEAASLEAVIFFQAMGVDPANGTYETFPEGSWQVLDADPQQAEALAARFLGKNIAVRPLAMALDSELVAAGVYADVLKCVADTGEHFSLSADLGTFISENQESGGRPALKAIELAVDCLVGTDKSIIFDHTGEIDRNFRDFLMFLDGATTYVLDKIELWSGNTNLIWNTVVKRSKNIRFIVNIQNEMGRVAISENMSKEWVVDHNFGERYSLAEGSCKPDNDRSFTLRAIKVEHYHSPEKTVLLTNIPQDQATQVEIMEKYLKRMSSIHKNNNSNGLNIGTAQSRPVFDIKAITGCSNIETLLKMTFDLLKKKTRDFLFGGNGSEAVLEDLLNVPGYIKYEQAAIHVLFVPRKGFLRMPEFEVAVNVANHSCITDYNDRKYYFSIVPSDDK